MSLSNFLLVRQAHLYYIYRWGGWLVDALQLFEYCVVLVVLIHHSILIA